MARDASPKVVLSISIDRDVAAALASAVEVQGVTVQRIVDRALRRELLRYLAEEHDSRCPGFSRERR